MAAESIAWAIVLGITSGAPASVLVWWLIRKDQQVPRLSRLEVKVFGIQIVIDLFPVDRPETPKE
jgi:hypothetical protein